MKTALRLLLAPYRFSVDRLFRMGEIGGAHWFDSPSLYPGGNHLYLYKDNAGTTPVTAVGDTIGLSLDRAYGGYRGPELATNTSVTGLPAGGGTRAYSTGATVVSGRTYAIQATVTDYSGTSVVGFSTGGSGTLSSVQPISGNGTISAIRQAAANGLIELFTLTSNTCNFSNISVREIPGTHLIQATGTARPTLSARVNLLTYTEQFDNAAWVKSASSSVTANAGTAPNGTATADRITLDASELSRVQQSVSFGFSTSFKFGCWMCVESGTATVRFGESATLSNVNLTTTWQWVTTTGSSTNPVFTIRNESGGGAKTLLVWGADLRTADDAAKNIPAYQRVGATAADHDTDGFPHGQYPDGTDDNQTTTTGGGGTTGFFYCGAITVSGGAGTDRTIWSDTGTNTGYRVRINSSNKLELAAGNGSAYTTVASNETITAPGTYILSAWDDGGVLAVQVNNFAAATTTRPTVSAGTSTVTMYKDNGAASSYLNGRDYGSVYRQSYIGETAHNRLKRWLADRARVTL